MPAHGAYGLSAATLSSDRIRCCVACILNEMNAARPNEQTCSLREDVLTKAFQEMPMVCVYLSGYHLVRSGYRVRSKSTRLTTVRGMSSW